MPIWLGGPEVSYQSLELLMEHSQLEGIMVGEGEETFLELLEYYLKKETNSGYDGTLERIPGLALPMGYTKQRPLTDLNKVPFLYYHPEKFQNKII